MPSPRLFLITSVAALTFGPGLFVAASSDAAGPQQWPQAGMSAPAPAPLVIAQAKPAPEAQDGAAAQPAPPKPYKPVNVTLPKPVADPSFDAFRKQLGDVAERKDKAAFAGLVAPKVFHLGADGKDKADPQQSGMEYLSELLDLDSGEPFGWDSLAAAARDPTADPLPQRQGVICGPGAPGYDDTAFEALLKSTGTDEFEWAYSAAQLDVRASNAPNTPVSEKLGTILLRIMPDSGAAGGDAQPGSQTTLPVVTPSGKIGYVAAAALRPLSSDQLCYAKQGGGWKIVGYVGGE